MFNVLSQDRVQQRIVEPINGTPAVSLFEEITERTIPLVRETVEMPQVQFLHRVRGCIIEEIAVPIPRMMEETIEVEKPMSQRFTLLVDNKLAPKLDNGCAVQAPVWEELQRLRDEGLMTVHANDSDNLELFKETLLSPIMMQVQSNKKGVACRARAVIRNSSGSSRSVGKSPP